MRLRFPCGLLHSSVDRPQVHGCQGSCCAVPVSGPGGGPYVSDRATRNIEPGASWPAVLPASLQIASPRTCSSCNLFLDPKIPVSHNITLLTQHEVYSVATRESIKAKRARQLTGWRVHDSARVCEFLWRQLCSGPPPSALVPIYNRAHPLLLPRSVMARIQLGSDPLLQYEILPTNTQKAEICLLNGSMGRHASTNQTGAMHVESLPWSLSTSRSESLCFRLSSLLS